LQFTLNKGSIMNSQRKMKEKIFLMVLIFIIHSGFLNPFAQEFLKKRDHFQLTQWKFFRGEKHLAESPNLTPGSEWAEVTVPHTWNAKDVLTKGADCYQGIAWYRTDFKISPGDEKERYFIRFEGVCLVADLFLNGNYLGKHKGGYSAFCFEITPFINYDKNNTIAVKVDNSIQPDVAPSGSHLYYLFGGIYRPVTVLRLGEICVSPLDYGSGGVYIKQKNITREVAEIEVETLLDYSSLPDLQTGPENLLPPEGKQGKGLYGEYFSNSELKEQPAHIRFDPQVDFDFKQAAPFNDMSPDNFSIRWMGRFLPPKTGFYKFIVISDDGSRLYINDEMVINHWGAHAASEKSFKTKLEAGKELNLEIEYNEYGGDASMKFGWFFFEESERPVEVLQKTSIVDNMGNVVASNETKVAVMNNRRSVHIQKFSIQDPHLWNAKEDPYMYTLRIHIEDLQGNVLDEVEQPLGLRFFKVDKDGGLILNDQPYHLYGVCRHQEWEGLGSALKDEHHEKDIELILELGANGVRLAHYQQADKMYSLCDENGLIVWSEIPNTPVYRKNSAAYLENCKEQLMELIKQNYNHPSIFFWGMYNEIPIPVSDLTILHETAKELDPGRLTTLADFVQVNENHFITDLVAWNWYFGWYYGDFGEYSKWYNELHREYPDIIAGLSEYGAGGCISQQQENPERPDPGNGKFFPEQYQRIYHERVWSQIKDRRDIWCKFIWNMFDFTWTTVNRGDRPYINHKGLITHDRKVKKDAFYFYKANWSDQPVLYIMSRRNTERTEAQVDIAVYTNLSKVELFVNGKSISKKKMKSDIHKITWNDIILLPGRNYIGVIGYKGDKKYMDACEWTYSPPGHSGD
jgi:hypothetical protein